MSDAPCPHCRRLREERDEALEALRQAQADTAYDEGERLFVAARALGLTQQSCRVLFELLRVPEGRLVSADRLHAVLSEAYFNDFVPAENLGRVYISYIRRWCGGRAIIENVHGSGYRFTAGGQAAVRAWLEETALASERGSAA